MKESENREETDVALAVALAEDFERIRGEIAKEVVGQEEVVTQLLVALLAQGHALLVGVPGLAKTRLIATLAKVVDLRFNRIQFTPDLMPADITGTDILEEDPETGRRRFTFMRGPVFTNLLLADEVNRTPPKTQAALLQAMEEGVVTAGGRSFPLEAPFHVFATQNPLEQEGTYPLPEAQLDRFMFRLQVDYPTEEEECAMVRETTSEGGQRATPVLQADRLKRYQELARAVPVTDTDIQLAVELVRRSRPGDAKASKRIRETVRWGAGPRASQNMILAAKAHALLHGQFAVTRHDLRQVAPPILSHRILTSFRAEAAGITVEQLTEELLKSLF